MYRKNAYFSILHGTLIDMTRIIVKKQTFQLNFLLKLNQNQIFLLRQKCTNSISDTDVIEWKLINELCSFSRFSSNRWQRREQYTDKTCKKTFFICCYSRTRATSTLGCRKTGSSNYSTWFPKSFRSGISRIRKVNSRYVNVFHTQTGGVNCHKSTTIYMKNIQKYTHAYHHHQEQNTKNMVFWLF